MDKDKLKQLKNSIERIIPFEEKLGIRIENISFRKNSGSVYFDVFGDFFMDDLDNFQNYRRIEIHATFYNEDGDIISTEHTSIFKDEFLGFQTFEINAYQVNPNDIDRIRIYPQAIK